MLAVTNGTAQATSPGDSIDATSPPATKRKRLSTDGSNMVNGVGEYGSLGDRTLGAQHAASSNAFADVVTALRRYDLSPSIFETDIPAEGEKFDEDRQPSKKVRLSSSSSQKTTTVASRLNARQYTSIDELAADIRRAILVREAEAGETASEGAHNGSAGSSETATLALLALKKKLLLLMGQNAGPASPVARSTADDVESRLIKSEHRSTFDDISLQETVADEDQGGRTVLTLFATTNGPNQLFSSLQRTSTITAKSDAKVIDTVDVSNPISDNRLPRLLSATTIPASSVSQQRLVSKRKKAGTFGEVFAPSPRTQPLPAPQPSRPMSSRGTSVTWGHQQPSHRADHRGLYSTQKQSTGHWLSYGGVSALQEPSSPNHKRRQRERALSTGEANPQPSRDALFALQQAKGDAAFRAAYASFAPCRDNSYTIVPEQVKSRVWWQRLGKSRFMQRQGRAISPALIDPALADDTDEPNFVESQDIDEEAIEDAIENWEPQELEMMESDKPLEDKEAQEILDEVSGLIETLSSYQRIRQNTLLPGSRTPMGSSISMNGSPTVPSDAENELYHTLRLQLVFMIQNLPPFLVAKLNIGQLKELNVSRSLPMENADFSGSMEEDQATRIAKASALQAASGSRTASSSHGHYGHPNQQTRAPAHGTPVSGSRQHLASQHRTQSAHHGSSHRVSSSGHHRPSAAHHSSSHRASSYAGLQQQFIQTPRQASTYNPSSGHRQMSAVNSYYATPSRPSGYTQANGVSNQPPPGSNYRTYQFNQPITQSSHQQRSPLPLPRQSSQQPPLQASHHPQHPQTPSTPMFAGPPQMGSYSPQSNQPTRTGSPLKASHAPNSHSPASQQRQPPQLDPRNPSKPATPVPLPDLAALQAAQAAPTQQTQQTPSQPPVQAFLQQPLKETADTVGSIKKEESMLPSPAPDVQSHQDQVEPVKNAVPSPSPAMAASVEQPQTNGGVSGLLDNPAADAQPAKSVSPAV